MLADLRFNPRIWKFLFAGRMYDSHLLDMVEFGIEHYKGLKEFKTQKVSLGIKPCLLFAGELFEHNHEYKRIKSLLIDIFQREIVQAVRLQGLEHVLMFTAAEDRIYFRSYRYDRHHQVNNVLYRCSPYYAKLDSCKLFHKAHKIFKMWNIFNYIWKQCSLELEWVPPKCRLQWARIALRLRHKCKWNFVTVNVNFLCLQWTLLMF